MNAGQNGRTVQALDVARALAGTGNQATLRELLALLARGDAEAARTWHVLLHGGLLPLLAHVADERGLLADAPAPLRDSLRSALEVNTIRNAVLRRVATDATRTLSAHGVPSLWAKGLWLAHRVYPHPGLRTMADIDLIVPLGMRAQARQALETAGFALDGTMPQEGAAEWTDTLSRNAPLPQGDAVAQLDLHDALRTSAVHLWPVRRLWERAQPFRQAGPTALAPSAEAGFLYLAAHLYKHGFDLRHTLVAIVDAAAVLQAAGDTLDVEWMLTELDDTRDVVAVYLLLALVGASPSEAGRRLQQQVGDRMSAAGLTSSADRLLESVRHLSLITASDFSLFEVGEQRSLLTVAGHLLAGIVRWRRRTGGTPGAVAGGGALSRLTRGATWRYAYTSFLAGRLHARSAGVTAGRD